MSKVFTEILIPMGEADYYLTELQRTFPLKPYETLTLQRRIGSTTMSAIVVCGDGPFSLDQRRFLVACGLDFSQR